MIGNVYTLFPPGEPLHLNKDPGMVPRSLGKALRVPATLVAVARPSWVGARIPAGLQVELIQAEGYRPRRPDRRILAWLRRRSAGIHCLHLFHFSMESVLYGLAYRHWNPRGLLYLKLDLDPVAFEHAYLQHPATGPWPVVSRWLRRRLLASCDVISAETTRALQVFRQRFPFLGNRLVLMPNGVDEAFAAGARQEPWSPVAGLTRLLSVGRLGTRQKNTELLLAALEGLPPEAWEVTLAGEETPEIARHLDAFLRGHPAWQGRLTRLGPVEDRGMLGRLFARSDVFCLPTRWETYGLVLGEALLAGCGLVVTDVPAAHDFVDGPQMGRIVPQEDPAALAGALQALARTHAEGREERQRRGSRLEWGEVIQVLAREVEQWSAPSRSCS